MKYDKLDKLLDAVAEVCSWQWEEILDRKYDEPELYKDLKALDKIYREMINDKNLL